MIIYHLIFDLNFFLNANIDPLSGIWLIIGRISATLFILLAGMVTASISIHNNQKTARKKNLSRAGKILCASLVVSIATYYFSPENTVYLGILHFLGLAILISTLLNKTAAINGILALIFFASGTLLFRLEMPQFIGILLGNPPENFSSFDYFPLLPWLGIYYLGMIIEQYRSRSKKYYCNTESAIFTPARVIGRYSLPVYLLHQPLLIGIIYFIG